MTSADTSSSILTAAVRLDLARERALCTAFAVGTGAENAAHPATHTLSPNTRSSMVTTVQQSAKLRYVSRAGGTLL